MDAQELETTIRKYATEDGDEIIEAVHKLAEVDIKMKAAMDEIETLDLEDAVTHNKLAQKVNELVDKACDSSSDTEDSDLKGKHEKPEQKKPETIKVEVHLVRARPMPLALMALLDFLNS